MSTMPMSGHTWLGAAASFLAMWVVMMVAMMLPSLVPTLWRYRQAGLGQLTTLVGVLLAGFLQFTAWKARHLACCRAAPAGERDRTAWQHGLSLGLHCSQCCAGLMAILLVIGVMNFLAMAVVAAAITVERLAPAGERVARATGVVGLGAGLFLIVRAAGLG
jgi:predicted metal-binding membrane protein